MATTPEGKVKKKIKEVLEKYKDENIYHYMPVPGGFGKPSLDYLGCFYGHFFAIEAKAPGKKPTERQNTTIEKMRAAGAEVFVVNDDASLKEFEFWLDFVYKLR